MQALFDLMRCKISSGLLMRESSNNHDIRCPACHTLNPRFESFCQACDVPIGVTATLDPVSTIRTEAFLFRRALDLPNKPIVLIGMWILFLPLIVFGIGIAIYLIVYTRGVANFFFFWVFVGLIYVALMILYRTTKNYVALRRKS